jgi:hypothetical protein
MGSIPALTNPYTGTYEQIRKLHMIISIFVKKERLENTP